uniref:Uncharacterized protein n=1 Tax=Arundo donax TaxID=35708 RepID=A0A0A9C3S0_ARUDO
MPKIETYICTLDFRIAKLKTGCHTQLLSNERSSSRNDRSPT